MGFPHLWRTCGALCQNVTKLGPTCKDLLVDKYGMRIDELTLPLTRQSAGTILRQAGYQPLGKGSYANVWVRPGQPFALKLFSSTDRAYMAFTQLAQQHPNPHFPVIKGKPIKITHKYNAVRIEFLNAPTTRWWKIIRLCGNYLEAMQLVDTGHGDREHVALVKQFRFSNRDLAQAIDLIYEKIMKGNANVANDIDIRNCRVRGNTLVFTDPISWAGPLVYGIANEDVMPTEDEEKAIIQDKAMKKRVRVRDLWAIAMPGNDATYPALSGMGV